MGLFERGGIKAAAGHSRPSDLEYVHRHFLGIPLGHFGFDQILDGGDLVRLSVPCVYIIPYTRLYVNSFFEKRCTNI